jgi:hypothetical protein
VPGRCPMPRPSADSPWRSAPRSSNRAVNSPPLYSAIRRNTEAGPRWLLRSSGIPYGIGSHFRPMIRCRVCPETRMNTPTTGHAPRRGKRPTSKRGVRGSIAPKSSDSSASPSTPFIDADRRNAMISDAAYFRSERRGFCPGQELDDWLTAEREIDHLLSSDQPATGCGT